MNKINYGFAANIYFGGFDFASELKDNKIYEMYKTTFS